MVVPESCDLCCCKTQMCQECAPVPSPTMTPTQTRTRTPSSTRTQTPTATRTPSKTSTGTETPTCTRTPTRTTSPSRTATSTNSLSRTPSTTRTSTSTGTPTTTTTGTATETPSTTRTPTETQTATTTMTLTHTPSSTLSASRTSTPTLSPAACTSSSSTSTKTATGTSASSTASATSSPTFTNSPSVSPSCLSHSGASTFTNSSSESGAVFVSSTPSGTVTSTTSETLSTTSAFTASVATLSSHAYSASGDPGLITPTEGSIASETSSSAVDLGGTLTSYFAPGIIGMMMILLCGFIAYRRKRNKANSKRYEDPMYLYAQELGVHVSMLGKQKLCRDATDAEPQSCEDLPRDNLSKTAQLNGSEVSLSSEMMRAKAVNPLLAQAHYRLSGEAKPEQLTHSPTETYTHLATAQKPRVEFVDLSDRIKSQSSIRVASVKKPRVEAGGRSGRTIQVAMSRNIDRSDMRVADKALLRLREWKAYLLAEPPPLIEIESMTKLGDLLSTGAANQQPVETTKETRVNSNETINRLRFARKEAAVGFPVSRVKHSRTDKANGVKLNRTRTVKTEFMQMLPSNHDVFAAAAVQTNDCRRGSRRNRKDSRNLRGT
eukprot:gb/GECG01010908.1/.p1 GENE.gb/GECG01010908.1/~~gb/GECG01010908.1/.p1  ORF type:complete len:606 (+),score=51.74 gb/GECG01010908.1/:1-1818(+)